MPEHHRAGAFTTQDQTHFKCNTYLERLEPGVTFAQIFDPGFWLHARSKLKQNDLIRLIAHDQAFDILVTVRSVAAGGVVMRYLSGDPGPDIDDPFKAVREIRERNIEPKIVPLNNQGEPLVRVEFIPATKWRVIGINGSEVKRGMENREEAEKALEAYLKELNMRMPSDAEKKAHVKGLAEKANPADA